MSDSNQPDTSPLLERTSAQLPSVQAVNSTAMATGVAEDESVLEAEKSALTSLGGPEFSTIAPFGKAAALHQLKTAGFPVPAGFLVHPKAVLGIIKDELGVAIEVAGGYPVAVRSSAQLEDLAAVRFAGQYETHLEVNSLAEVIEAIAACRASAFSPQLVSYSQQNGLCHSTAKVGVLVQRMVKALVAGVTFSIHPETGCEEHALVECCRGLGNQLVAGQISPTRYVVRLEDGSVAERQAGAEDVWLDSGILHKLCQHALEVQAHFGTPQDIEWAIDCGGEVWILQSRPITRIRWRADIDEFTTANLRDGGVSARVCTPLMYSLY